MQSSTRTCAFAWTRKSSPRSSKTPTCSEGARDMSRFFDMRVTLRTAVAALAILALAPLSIVASEPVFAADLAAAKSTVDAAKAGGTVGEQADGYLGYVNGSADPATTAAVTAINAARGDVYRQTAAKT